MTARAALLGLCATLVLTGCGSNGPSEDTEASPGSPQQEEETVPQTPSAVPGAGTAPARKAVADLASRLGLAEAEISVQAVEAVTWNDGSLGCAEKGTMYTQALVEGTRITLRAADRTYEYHAGGPRAPFYCANPTQ